MDASPIAFSKRFIKLVDEVFMIVHVEGYYSADSGDSCISYRHGLAFEYDRHSESSCWKLQSAINICL